MSRIPLNQFCVVCASRRIKLLRIWRALADFGVPSAFQHPNVPQTNARRDRIQNARCWGFPSRWIPASSCMSGTAWQSCRREWRPALAARRKKDKKKRHKTRQLEACLAGRGPALIRALSYSSLLATTPTWSVCACQSSSAEAHRPTRHHSALRRWTSDAACFHCLRSPEYVSPARLRREEPENGRKKKKKKRNSRQKRPWRNALVDTSHCHRLPEAPPSL